MTVRYRPICLHQAWRSQLSHSLTSVERYGELYFLTNPATNSIGCYQVIPRISGAELGMSTEELQNAINRLEEMKVVIYKDGYILVRTWFFHSTWESTLQGNVLKTALADIRRIPASLQPYWRDSCVEAGVPESVVEEVLQQALASPLQGTCKGLSHVTNTKQKANQKPTTTTTQLVSVVAASLELLPCAEPHRDTLLTLAGEHGLTESQLQDLGWELSARLHAAEQGQGKPIGLVARWLSALAHALQEGTPIHSTLRLILLRGMREGSVPDMSIEDIAEILDTDREHDLAPHLRRILGDIGAETDERFEYVDADDNFKVHVEQEASEQEEEVISDALMRLDSIVSRRHEPIRQYFRSIQRHALLSAAEELQLGQEMDSCLQQAIDLVATDCAAIRHVLDAVQHVQIGSRKFGSISRGWNAPWRQPLTRLPTRGSTLSFRRLW